MKISQHCLGLIKPFEGLRLDAYLDPVRIPTIGYGTIRYPDGRKVRLGDVIPEQEAEAFLKLECDKVAADVSTGEKSWIIIAGFFLSSMPLLKRHEHVFRNPVADERSRKQRLFPVSIAGSPVTSGP